MIQCAAGNPEDPDRNQKHCLFIAMLEKKDLLPFESLHRLKNEVKLDSISLSVLHKNKKKQSSTSADTSTTPSFSCFIPQVLRSVHKAGQNYPTWKAANSPDHKPWLYPIQSELPMMDPAELSIQRGDSLENVDESLTKDAKESEDSS